MMRKLIVLVAVLAMTSVASAQIIDIWITSLDGEMIDPVKEITIAPSQWVNLDIIYQQDEADPLMTLDTMVVLTGPGTLDLTQLTWPYDEGFNNVVGETIATGAFMGMGDGVLVDHILVHCDDIGEVTVVVLPSMMFGGTNYTTGAYTGAWGPGVVITQIPEPMTIALLGLGGLFLLRRRK